MDGNYPFCLLCAGLISVLLSVLAHIAVKWFITTFIIAFSWELYAVTGLQFQPSQLGKCQSQPKLFVIKKISDLVNFCNHWAGLRNLGKTDQKERDYLKWSISEVFTFSKQLPHSALSAITDILIHTPISYTHLYQVLLSLISPTAMVASGLGKLTKHTPCNSTLLLNLKWSWNRRCPTKTSRSPSTPTSLSSGTTPGLWSPTIWTGLKTPTIWIQHSLPI